MVQLGEASRLELLEEEPRLGDPREREVARDLEERRAQRRAVVYLGHECGTLAQRRLPRAGSHAARLLAFRLPGEL